MLIRHLSIFDFISQHLEGNYAVVHINESVSLQYRAYTLDHTKKYNYELARCHGILFIDAVPKMDWDSTEYFTESHALAISMFYHSMRTIDVDIMYILCESGVSISPAVAAAFHRYVGEDDKHNFLWMSVDTWPSSSVYKKMCHPLHIGLAHNEISQLELNAAVEYERLQKEVESDEHLHI